MRILDRSVYVGPSLYAHFPVIRLELDLGALEDWPSARLGESFVSGLLEALPGLAEHGCSYREPGGFIDCIEAHLRAWFAAHPALPAALRVAVRGALRDVITDVQRAHTPQSPPGPVGDIVAASARLNHDNERPPPSPHLRI